MHQGNRGNDAHQEAKQNGEAMVGCCPAAATSANLRPAKLLAVFFVIWRHLVAAREVSVNTNGNFFCVFLTGTSYPEPAL